VPASHALQQGQASCPDALSPHLPSPGDFRHCARLPQVHSLPSSATRKKSAWSRSLSVDRPRPRMSQGERHGRPARHCHGRCGAQTAVAIVASPLVAFTIAFATMLAVAWWRRVSRLQDDAKPIQGTPARLRHRRLLRARRERRAEDHGLTAALLVGSGHANVRADGSVPIAECIPLGAYGSIAIGSVWGGRKIIETMGLRITTLCASAGLVANVGRAAPSAARPCWACRSRPLMRPRRQ
jgi:hypothetical protein